MSMLLMWKCGKERIRLSRHLLHVSDVLGYQSKDLVCTPCSVPALFPFGDWFPYFVSGLFCETAFERCKWNVQMTASWVWHLVTEIENSWNWNVFYDYLWHLQNVNHCPLWQDYPRILKVSVCLNIFQTCSVLFAGVARIHSQSTWTTSRT